MDLLPFCALDLQPFVPGGGDFAAAERFVRALGFEVAWRHDGLLGLRFGDAAFLLQRFEDRHVQEQTMVVLTVDDLDAFWAHVAAQDLARALPGVRVAPPKELPWGREVHLIDPAGVCWHVREAPAPRAARPVTLEGAHVRLEPLARHHFAALIEVGLDEELWRWTSNVLRTRQDIERYLEDALAEARRGLSLPFATIARGPATEGAQQQDTVVGSTRFGNVALEHCRVEIGWTWIGRPWQRSAVNTEAKLLLLRHAFGPLGCRRVELKTDALNARSRAAIARLGAREEGTLRRHTSTSTGRVRDTVYYSITDEEWPSVEAGLVQRLSRG